MRLLLLILLGLVCLIQYPLWLGKGGWLKVWELQRQVVARRSFNEGMRARNAALDAEVRDLQTGTGALEERARSELGMMKAGEVFVHIVSQDKTTLQHASVPKLAWSRAAPVASSRLGSANSR